jgi:hypothetical protein
MAYECQGGLVFRPPRRLDGRDPVALHHAMRFALILGILLSGCTATVGPYVTDIQALPDGRWKIISCTTEVSQTGNFLSADVGECTSKVIGQPRSP